MKANEAPEKIYLQVCGDCQDNECDNRKLKELEDNVTWCKDEIFDKDIEYTRTDAFIEKAETYLKEKFAKDVSILTGGVVYINFETAINNFINYMKKE